MAYTERTKSQTDTRRSVW